MHSCRGDHLKEQAKSRLGSHGNILEVYESVMSGNWLLVLAYLL